MKYVVVLFRKRAFVARRVTGGAQLRVVAECPNENGAQELIEQLNENLPERVVLSPEDERRNREAYETSRGEAKGPKVRAA